MPDRDTPRRQPVSTGIRCEVADEHRVKPGIHFYQQCPVCGRPLDGRHEIEFDVHSR